MAGAGWSSGPGKHREKKGGVAARDEEHRIEKPRGPAMSSHMSDEAFERSLWGSFTHQEIFVRDLILSRFSERERNLGDRVCLYVCRAGVVTLCLHPNDLQSAWQWGLDKEEPLVAVDVGDEFCSSFFHKEWHHSLVNLPKTKDQKLLLKAALDGRKRIKVAFVDKRTLRDLEYFNSLTNHRRQGIARNEEKFCPPCYCGKLGCKCSESDGSTSRDSDEACGNDNGTGTGNGTGNGTDGAGDDGEESSTGETAPSPRPSLGLVSSSTDNDEEGGSGTSRHSLTFTGGASTGGAISFRRSTHINTVTTSPSSFTSKRFRNGTGGQGEAGMKALNGTFDKREPAGSSSSSAAETSQARVAHRSGSNNRATASSSNGGCGGRVHRGGDGGGGGGESVSGRRGILTKGPGTASALENHCSGVSRGGRSSTALGADCVSNGGSSRGKSTPVTFRPAASTAKISFATDTSPLLSSSSGSNASGGSASGSASGRRKSVSQSAASIARMARFFPLKIGNNTHSSGSYLGGGGGGNGVEERGFARNGAATSSRPVGRCRTVDTGGCSGAAFKRDITRLATKSAARLTRSSSHTSGSGVSQPIVGAEVCTPHASSIVVGTGGSSSSSSSSRATRSVPSTLGSTCSTPGKTGSGGGSSECTIKGGPKKSTTGASTLSSRTTFCPDAGADGENGGIINEGSSSSKSSSISRSFGLARMESPPSSTLTAEGSDGTCEGLSPANRCLVFGLSSDANNGETKEEEHLSTSRFGFASLDSPLSSALAAEGSDGKCKGLSQADRNLIFGSLSEYEETKEEHHLREVKITGIGNRDGIVQEGAAIYTVAKASCNPAAAAGPSSPSPAPSEDQIAAGHSTVQHEGSIVLRTMEQPVLPRSSSPPPSAGRAAAPAEIVQPKGSATLKSEEQPAATFKSSPSFASDVVPRPGHAPFLSNMQQRKDSAVLHQLMEQPRLPRSSPPSSSSRSSPSSRPSPSSQRNAAFEEEEEENMARVESPSREKDAALQASQRKVKDLLLLLRENEESSNRTARVHQQEVAEVERKAKGHVERLRARDQSLCEDTARAAATEGEWAGQETLAAKGEVAKLKSVQKQAKEEVRRVTAELTACKQSRDWALVMLGKQGVLRGQEASEAENLKRQLSERDAELAGSREAVVHNRQELLRLSHQAEEANKKAEEAVERAKRTVLDFVEHRAAADAEISSLRQQTTELRERLALLAAESTVVALGSRAATAESCAPVAGFRSTREEHGDTAMRRPLDQARREHLSVASCARPTCERISEKTMGGIASFTQPRAALTAATKRRPHREEDINLQHIASAKVQRQGLRDRHGRASMEGRHGIEARMERLSTANAARGQWLQRRRRRRRWNNAGTGLAGLVGWTTKEMWDVMGEEGAGSTASLVPRVASLEQWRNTTQGQLRRFRSDARTAAGVFAGQRSHVMRSKGRVSARGPGRGLPCGPVPVSTVSVVRRRQT